MIDAQFKEEFIKRRGRVEDLYSFEGAKVRIRVVSSKYVLG